jgi:hypothetical protein
VDCGITEFSTSTLNIVEQIGEQISTTSALNLYELSHKLIVEERTQTKLQLDVDYGITEFSTSTLDIVEQIGEQISTTSALNLYELSHKLIVEPKQS